MSAYTPEQAAQIDWTARWEKYHIPVRFQGLGLADMDRTEDNAKALDFAQRIVDTWPQRRPLRDAELPEDRSLIGKGGIIIGAYGTGKTRLMCATATDVARRYNTAALYVPVARFFSLGKDNPEAALALRRQVTRVPFLLWDDQGTEYESGSGWVGSEVYRILRGRFDRALPTLITTNVPLPEWSTKYEGSLFSFLQEAFDAVILGGKDRRRAAR